MKNYLVKATINFNDMEEKTEMGTDTPRKINDVFYCTKERYEYLKEHNAVMLVGIDEIKEQSVIEKKETIKNNETKKKKTSKK